jgi:hypothetical protein
MQLLKIKNRLLVFVIFLCNISSVFADKPTLYVEILKSDKVVNIQSHLLWNVDENTKIPNCFISGNNTFHIEKFKLGKNRLKVKLFFPKQENGRRLNATTTIHLAIHMNGKEIINTKHFGQNSQEYVKHPDSTLCRPDIVSLVLLNKKRKLIQLKVQGEYTPKKTHPNAQLSYSDERFALDYLSSSVVISDKQLAEDVAKFGPIPRTLNHVKEILTIGSLNKTSIYSFDSNINNLEDDSPYDWGSSSFLYCTETASESKLTDVFNPFMHEYTQFEEQSTLRIFDPNTTFFSNDIRFNPENVVKTGTNTYRLSNLTNNYILVNGLKVLNPINQKEIKIFLMPNWTIEKVEVGENTTYKNDDYSLRFYGNGLSRLNYTIYIREKK